MPGCLGRGREGWRKVKEWGKTEELGKLVIAGGKVYIEYQGCRILRKDITKQSSEVQRKTWIDRSANTSQREGGITKAEQYYADSEARWARKGAKGTEEATWLAKSQLQHLEASKETSRIRIRSIKKDCCPTQEGTRVSTCSGKEARTCERRQQIL